ncbi:hypothetical protein [Leucobacter denitrificans]|uniref:ABC-2 type transport system permease protein n=1 Tax=Leucobacter denitrificans TaxID=683042 RepID=A0A7G9S4X5_9MICO|nr:hypothetical protein [Leucobacter denitrificans]QNN62900.1 hypothetical protein H9L06_00445 [Leucobacter denitrificans]
MVTRLFRLRVALAGGLFRGSVLHALRVALLLLVCAAIAVAAALVPSIVVEPGEVRDALDIIMGAVIVALAMLYPFFDNRRYLVPKQFSQYPVGPAKLAWSMLVTSCASWSFLLLLVWVAALVVSRPEWLAGGWIAALVLVLVVVFTVVGVRLAAGLSQLLAGDRFAGGLRLTGGVLGIALIPILVFGITEVFRSEDNRMLVEAAGPLAWSPFGAGFAAIHHLSVGEVSAAGIKLAVLGGTTLCFALLWFVVVHRSVTRIELPLDSSNAKQGLGWFERFAARPAQVIAARQLTYWMRDPRYKIALIALPVAPIAILVAFLVAGADFKLAVALPLPVLLLLLGWSQHNDIAMDSTAIWEHVASGVRGWADRAGRLAPILFVGVPVAVIGSSLTVTFMGDWRILPAVIGMNLGVLLVSTGVASAFSAIMPYPATRPGDSPFVQPQWSGSGSGTSQTLSMLAALLLSVPPVWSAVLAISSVTFVGNLWAFLFGVGYGLVVLLVGVIIGGRVFDKQGPEILAVTQIFD